MNYESNLPDDPNPNRRVPRTGPHCDMDTSCVDTWLLRSFDNGADKPNAGTMNITVNHIPENWDPDNQERFSQWAEKIQEYVKKSKL